MENLKWEDYQYQKSRYDKDRSDRDRHEKDRSKNKPDKEKSEKDKSEKVDKPEEPKVEKEETEKEDKPKEEKMEEDKPKGEEKEKEKMEPVNCMRVGWSVLSSSLQLGEGNHSYAYDSDGLKASNSEFTDYGMKFTANDVIGTFLNLESDPVTITYTVNGEVQDVAFSLTKSELPEDFVLFPHLLSRNTKFEVNFGQNDEPWFQPPEDLTDYNLIKNVEDKVPGVPRPEKREDCQVNFKILLSLCL